jgi:hypothetical protein
MGRRAHKPDPFHRRQVEAMAAFGIPEANIARVVGIDAKTLRKHYRDELDMGQTKATAKVAESLFRKATTDGPQSVTAAIFWLKTRGGWRETPQTHEIGGRDSSPLTVEFVKILGVPAEQRTPLTPPRQIEHSAETRLKVIK